MKPTFNQRLRYQFDNLMSRGTPAMIGMLFVLSLIVVLVAGRLSPPPILSKKAQGNHEVSVKLPGRA